MIMLNMLNKLEDFNMRISMFISLICKNKQEFSTFEEFQEYSHEKEHPVLSKIHKAFNKGVVLSYSMIKMLKKFYFYMYPVGNIIKSKILPNNDEIPFNIKFLYLNFAMLEEYVERFNIRRINANENEENKWRSDEHFEEIYELSNEIIDLYEWWQWRKRLNIDAGVDDATIRIEEDQKLIRLAKIRHRIWWNVG